MKGCRGVSEATLVSTGNVGRRGLQTVPRCLFGTVITTTTVTIAAGYPDTLQHLAASIRHHPIVSQKESELGILVFYSEDEETTNALQHIATLSHTT